MLYGGVLAVALIGAIVARFRPAGMMLAMSTTALAEALLPVIALIFGPRSKHRFGARSAGPYRLFSRAVAHGCFGKRRGSKFPRAQRRRLTRTVRTLLLRRLVLSKGNISSVQLPLIGGKRTL